MTKNKKIEITGSIVSFYQQGSEDYISLKDLARHKNAEYTGVVISHWLSTRYTVDFMGIWERVNNPKFNLMEFSYIRNEILRLLNSTAIHQMRLLTNNSIVKKLSEGNK